MRSPACGKEEKERFTPDVKEYVEKRVKDDLSPEQIAGKAKLQGITCVSHERIYRHVWEDKKNGGKLHAPLRTRGAAKDKRGQISGRVGIEKRSAVVDEKKRMEIWRWIWPSARTIRKLS